MKAVRTYGPWALCAYVAFVFVQSLFYKFSGSAESIHIFSTLATWSGIGLFEPVGRFGVGTVELVASVLLFVPAVRWLGALLGIGTMSGAIFFHLFTPLGVEIKGPGIEPDGGLLFAMACGVWIACAILLLLDRDRIMALAGLTPAKLA
ncbi:MAG: DoxX family protein [Alphaproteobacteria bacterium]|nr:DoxX family protein [Alphaproteobacteria bacterium]